MKTNLFSLSNTKLLSCDMGELVPIGLTEVLPGDTMQQTTSLLVRTMALNAPVMHTTNIRVHHWYVPHRLIWEDFEDFITGGPDGMDDSAFPTIDLSYAAGPPATGSGVVGGLADYLGCPPGINNLEVSALPFRAYALIYNEWYRDQDLVTPLTIDVGSGADTTTNTALQNIAWEKDRYTSARPWEQKGPAITIPLGDRANVHGIGVAVADTSVAAAPGAYKDATGNPAAVDFTNRLASTATLNLDMTATSAAGIPNVYADLTGASAITVTRLREALALQRYEEARARFGSRYTEYLRYYGVISSDARLQRPEYLGGGQNPIQFSEVLATAEGTNTEVGDLKGHGIGATRSNRYRRYFEEHGYVITTMSVRPKTIYMQGLPRTWNRRTKEDFFQKELAHIGQAEVQNKEIYALHADPDGQFGFQDRYDEYRSQESSVAGEFRTTDLNYWHMARDFSADPALNETFVKCVPTERIFPVNTKDVLYIKAMHSIQARRLVPASGSSFIF